MKLKQDITKKALKGTFDTLRLFKRDDDLKTITKNCQPDAEYRNVWKNTFQYYIDGKWGEAKTKFEEFMTLRPDITCTSVVYDYMKNRNFNAPSDWKGYRALTSK